MMSLTPRRDLKENALSTNAPISLFSGIDLCQCLSVKGSVFDFSQICVRVTIPGHAYGIWRFPSPSQVFSMVPVSAAHTRTDTPPSQGRNRTSRGGQCSWQGPLRSLTQKPTPVPAAPYDRRKEQEQERQSGARAFPATPLYPVLDADQLAEADARSTETPGPMVEDSDTFLR